MAKNGTVKFSQTSPFDRHTHFELILKISSPCLILAHCAGISLSGNAPVSARRVFQYPPGRLGTRRAGLEPASPSLLLSRRQMAIRRCSSICLLGNSICKSNSNRSANKIAICLRLNRSGRETGSRPARRVPSRPGEY